uniref:Peptidase_M1 domain-containing protein n=1 Tax=Bursaphelenchus xylophilus TaxID=6326 RepID=A0A1I7SGY1_BURXY
MWVLLWILSLYSVWGYGGVERHDLASDPDKNVIVESYEIEFDLRLINSYAANSNSRFRGDVKIRFQVLNSSDHVSLHACNLTVLRSSLSEFDNPSKDISITVTSKDDALDLKGQETFQVGIKYLLVFHFEGQIYNDPIGLHLQKDQRHQTKLLQSQFSPKNARRAFPNFDDPFHRAHFDLRLIIPRGIEAVSGSKVKHVIPQGQFETVVFERSDKIPSFLLGFAVGNFHKLSRTSQNGVNITLLTPHGYPSPSSFHLDAAVQCLDHLEGLLGRSFPVSELKLLATLNQGFSSESHGLIFLSSTTAFLSPTSDTRKLFQTVQNICHEISHHYFGDFVGFEDWTGLFLSEGLASYYGNRALEWNTTLKTYQNTQIIGKNLKALNAMKWAQHPVISDKGHYDAITYLVGEAMVRMFHSVLGDDIFSDAIGYYLEDRGKGTTNYKGFVAAMKKALRGQTICDGQISFEEFVDDFLTQTDHPVVYIDLVEDVYTFNVSATSSNNKWILPLHIWDSESERTELIWIKKDGTLCKPNKAFSLRNTRLLVFNPESSDFVAIHLSPLVINEYHRRLESYSLIRSMDNIVISSFATQLGLNAKTEIYGSCLLSIVDSLDVFKVPLRVVELVVESKLNLVCVLWNVVDWGK